MTAIQKPSTMSKEERRVIYLQYRELKNAGEIEKAYTVLKKMPLHPGLARVGKKALGIKYMQESGMNLADAVNEFGEEWLNDENPSVTRLI